MVELLLGCGHQRKKLACLLGSSPEWTDLVTLDNNYDCSPDIICDLNTSYWKAFRTKRSQFFDDAWFFKESMFNEVHAYEVLEHLGTQGDAESFFSTFYNIWHVLVDGGHLFATCPSRHSPWLWGDPGHTRVIHSESLIFLDQENYKQLGKTAMSDYRSQWKGDFKIINSTDDGTWHLFVLQAVKPVRKFGPETIEGNQNK